MEENLSETATSLLLSSMDPRAAPGVLSAPGVEGARQGVYNGLLLELAIPTQINSLTVEEGFCHFLERVLLRITSSSLTQLAIKSCLVTKANVLNDFLNHKGSALATVELVDLPWKSVAWAWVLRHLSSLELLCLEETGSDHSFLPRNKRGSVHCVLNALPGLNLPSLSRVRITSDIVVPVDSLIAFISFRVSTKPIQILCSHGTFSSTDLSSLQTVAQVSFLGQ
jgi:hypothetical protein